MYFFQISVLLTICTFAYASSKGILCYVCEDCDILDECLLQLCPLKPTAPTEIPPPQPTLKTTTNIPSTSSIQTSQLPSRPTTTSITETSGLPSTTSQLTSIDTNSPSTFETATSSTSTTDFTSSSGETETTEDMSTFWTIDVSTDKETSTFNFTSESTESPESRPKTNLAQDYKSLLLQYAVGTYSYHCYSIEIVDDNKLKKRRGCVKVPEEKSACEFLTSQFGCSSKNCKVCSEDRCNSATALRCSLMVIILTVVIRLN